MKNNRIIMTKAATWILLVFLSSQVFAQPETSSISSITPAPLSISSLNYKIAPGDILQISVEGEPDLTSNQQVDVNGEIRLVYIIDHKIPISGLTRLEAEQKITRAYFEHRILKRAQTTVNITNTAPKEVLLSGEVNRQGPYAFPPETESMEISELIMRAGGMTPIAKSWAVRLTRKGESQWTEHDVRKMLNGTNSETPIFINPGDQIWVPQRTW